MNLGKMLGACEPRQEHVIMCGLEKDGINNNRSRRGVAEGGACRTAGRFQSCMVLLYGGEQNVSALRLYQAA